MKITYEQLYRSYPVFKHLLDEPLPIATSLKIKRLVDSLNPHLEQIEATQNELIEKYSEDAQEEGMVEIPKENREKFMEELEKYLEYEIFINWDKLKLAQLGDQFTISVKGLETISYLLEDYDNVAVV
tara:strand:+ start:429 stop:812 length:384 start_codon:yes stop_codon:yes gene_type:complete